MDIKSSSEAILTSLTTQNAHIYLYISALLLGAGILFGWRWGSDTSDSKEPHVLPSKMPLIGYLIGIMQHQGEYLQKLATKVNLPIFTLKIFSGRVYVITSPELTQSVFRHSKSFSFDPINTAGSKRIFQMTDRQMKILAAPIPGISGVEFPLNTALMRAMHKVLTTGPNSPILIMNARALNRYAQLLNVIGREGKSVDMYAWFKESFTVATTAGLYGPDNPIEKDTSLVQSLCDFEDSLGLLFLNKWPSITAPKGHRGRLAFAAAFKTYHEAGHDSKTTGVVPIRREMLCAGGFNTDDLAAFDIGIMMAASMNSKPALFWLMCFIYSDVDLLADIRKEVDKAVVMGSNREACIDISQLLKNCPLLVSSLQETLRVIDATISSRMVVEDTLLNDTYFLRKGGIIQLACGPMHTSPSIWGSDSYSFNSRRFLKSTQELLSKDKRKAQKNGFTPFGGGAALCPGRHFVTMEILGVAATLVVGYDISMKDGSQLKMPAVKKQTLGVQVKHPAHDLGVTVTRRKEYEGCTWVYDIGAGELAEAEDMAFNN